MAALTTAYAGHADITAENAGAILNQFLPQDPPEGVGLGLVLIPERVIRAQKGLKATIAWLETELGGSDATIPVADLIAAMLERKEKEGDDLELYLLLDPENEDDLALANAANDAGIPVRNLAAAGDFIEFRDEEEVPAEQETPPFDVDETQAAVEAVVAQMDPGLTPVVAGANGITINLNLPQEAINAIARAIVAQMANLGAAQVAAQSAPLASVTPIAPAADRPAEPGGRTEQVPGSSAFYYNSEAGTYRKARGMSRPGESKVFLTEDEQAQARTAKLLA